MLRMFEYIIEYVCYLATTGLMLYLVYNWLQNKKFETTDALGLIAIIGTGLAVSYFTGSRLAFLTAVTSGAILGCFFWLIRRGGKTARITTNALIVLIVFTAGAMIGGWSQSLFGVNPTNGTTVANAPDNISTISPNATNIFETNVLVTQTNTSTIGEPTATLTAKPSTITSTPEPPTSIPTPEPPTNTPTPEPPTSTPTPVPPTKTPPPPPLVDDKFDSPLSSEWRQLEAQWRVIDGYLIVLESSTEQGSIEIGDNSWDNYSIDFDTGGYANDWGSGNNHALTVFVRKTDSTNSVWFFFTPSYIKCGFRSNGNDVELHSRGGGFAQHVNTFSGNHHVRIEVRGSKYTLLIDGTQECSFEDTTVANGGVEFKVRDGAWGEWRWPWLDNVKIQRLN